MSACIEHLVDRPETGLAPFPTLPDSLSPGVLVVGRRGRLLSCSPEAAHWLSLPNEAPSGDTLERLPHALRSMIERVLAKPGAAVSSELTVDPGLPPRRELLVKISPVVLAPGEVIAVVTLSDLTGFRRLQGCVERLDRLATAGTLAASMAHEIKNALVAVKTFVELLLEKNKDAELASLVSREMSRVNAIVRQMLKFGSNQRPERAPVRLHDVLEHSLRMVKHQLDDKLISLNRAFDATSDTVHGDNHQLEQVFVNLFLNAVEATGANGSLTVRTEFISAAPPEISQPELVGRPHIRVVVADTGAGIAPEILPQLFEPFFTTKNHGTGLGLPITQRIVQEHQGLITVESEVSKGTTFSIILPANRSAA